MLLASKNSQDMTATSSLEPFQSLHLPPSQPRTAEDILSVEETTTSISFSSPFTPTQILATSTLTYQHQLTTPKSRDSRALLHKNLEKNQTQVKIKRKIKRNLRSIINRVAQNN